VSLQTFISHPRHGAEPYLLQKHLLRTSQRARAFGRLFSGVDWVALAALWHDLGKYHPDFQAAMWCLQHDPDAKIDKKPPHAAAGAFWARERFAEAARPLEARILEFLIACHHTGLQDWADIRRRLDDPDSREHKVWQELRQDLQQRLVDDGAGDILAHLLPDSIPDFKNDGFAFSFWLRMLFSCLIDADRLDAEAAGNGGKERAKYPPLVPGLASRAGENRDEDRDAALILKNRFDAHIKTMAATTVERLAKGELQQHVVDARNTVLADCRRAGREKERGFFTLTVPTGGGKTLSSMAFALEHAAQHGMERVIYVIPYTSIIEQNADVFKKIFNVKPGETEQTEANVIEHHSTFDDGTVRKEDSTHQASAHEHACENWDAPIIVTTSVQFFESLFAASTKRVRKLHNIANSVVILDEAQLLPPQFLQPILKALGELKDRYGVSVVLCTATQPALGRENQALKSFGLDLAGAEIVQDKDHLFQTLRRTTIQRLPELLDTPQDWPTLATRVARHEQVLCIVNRRDDARALYQALKAELPGQAEGLFHLSALMCPLHRRAVIDRIRARLQGKLPVRVISTQLIEAGVDVDFPVVYRALAGLDSIAQAAGRCNREGLREVGEVFLFEDCKDGKKLWDPTLQLAKQITQRFLEDIPDTEILHDTSFQRFFREFYGLYSRQKQGTALDAEGIIRLLECEFADEDEQPTWEGIEFATAQDRFKLIPDNTVTVITSYGDAEKYLKDLEFLGPSRERLRQLQLYSVSLYKTQMQDYQIVPVFKDNQQLFRQLVNTQYCIRELDGRGDDLGLIKAGVLCV
jgi:CRISPR-associated endonuclease/helicase Cas3